MELYVTGIIFCIAGILHFVFPSFYKKIMPPYIPAHYTMIYLSGLFEVLFGVLLMIPKTQTIGAVGIGLLLIAVFPANLYMAQRMQQKGKKYAWAAWLRLPLQLLLIWWVMTFSPWL